MRCEDGIYRITSSVSPQLVRILNIFNSHKMENKLSKFPQPTPDNIAKRLEQKSGSILVIKKIKANGIYNSKLFY